MGRILMANSTATAPTPPINLTSAAAAEALRKSGSFNPTLAVVVSAMIISFFVVGFASGYLRRWLWGQEAEEMRHSELMRRRRLMMNSTLGPSAHSKQLRGLDPEVVACMPLVRFKDLGGDEKYFDCPVCLAVFEGSDTLKLLPHCAHAFHSDCIDQWFRSHSTCPLCRVSMTSRPPVDANPSYSIRVPPNFDSTEPDAIPGSESHVAIGVPTAAASSASAEPEGNPRSNATVHSNVGGFGPSFVPAIRGGMATARAATLASLRRSSSVGTDLIQHGYVVDSEGTQHHRNLRVHVTIALDGVSRRPVACSWCARRSFPNLRQIAPI